jgi:thiol-disulfide isomerase/thioredoxin
VNSRNKTLLIVVGAIVVVLGLAGIAVLASGGGGSDSAGVVDPSQTVPGGGELQQNQPVVITGTRPVTFDDTVTPDPAIGTVFPVMKGKDFNGTDITVGGPTEQPTMVAFLAHWCPHCNREVPALVELNNRNGVPANLDVVGVSTGVDASAPNYPPSQWFVDEKWPWATMADDENSSAFVNSGGSGFPYVVILDTDGKILARDSGEKTAEQLAAWIKDALATSTNP